LREDKIFPLSVLMPCIAQSEGHGKTYSSNQPKGCPSRKLHIFGEILVEKQASLMATKKH